MSEWIYCSERLPSEELTVFISMRVGNDKAYFDTTKFAYMLEGGWRDSYDGTNYGKAPYAWMLVPAPAPWRKEDAK